MLKTIFFDLGNVLLFFSHSKMCEQISGCTEIPLEVVHDLLFKKKTLNLYESGRMSSLDMYNAFKEYSSKNFSLKDLFTAASDIFTPNTDIWPIVIQLKEMGIFLSLLSNISEWHFKYAYSKYPLLQLFDQAVLSFEVGALKPDPQIFFKALSMSKCSPQECLYIDDIPEFISGAKQVGLDGELFTTTDQFKKHLLQRGISLDS